MNIKTKLANTIMYTPQIMRLLSHSKAGDLD